MSVPEVLNEIRAAEAAAGRAAGSVRLVAVTKGHSLADIEEWVLPHGDFPLAENRGQELRDKVAQWPQREWHFIGPLQRNKIKYLSGVALVHSIEEVWQAQALAEAAQKWGRAPAILLQLHNGESQKHGVLPEELPGVLREVQATGLEVRGLMVMAPYDDPQRARAVFHQTAGLARALDLPELSMGMSDDYPAAIAAGATLVRVGRKLFT